MARVLFKGWRKCLRKMSPTKLIQLNADLPIDQAKAFTDKLLDGETFAFEIKDIKRAENFAREADSIGAICKVIKDND